ncbi:hypothetical protein DNL40_02335 [Xylanimonas oleitrophica]|uniref:Uncharacterized protein n=1 Tax=Xylanimonas oleitrophica TaxID=2607479 RepID=A0A2W5XX20_9MICO|nr:hypothetical protein [Xylanimonas oleitrophica]PZR55228.1 hypothetical protein DNL40_02335 [Xylanimonas oleitrophica]
MAAPHPVRGGHHPAHLALTVPLEVTVGYSTPVEQVRLLLADVASDEARRTLTDDQISGYLALQGGSEDDAPVWVVKRAAADALDAIATSEALVGKVVRTADGISTDGAKVADALRKHAQTLRDQAVQAEDDAAWMPGGPRGFGVIEFSPYP